MKHEFHKRTPTYRSITSTEMRKIYIYIPSTTTGICKQNCHIQWKRSGENWKYSFFFVRSTCSGKGFRMHEYPVISYFCHSHTRSLYLCFRKLKANELRRRYFITCVFVYMKISDSWIFHFEGVKDLSNHMLTMSTTQENLLESHDFDLVMNTKIHSRMYTMNIYDVLYYTIKKRNKNGEEPENLLWKFEYCRHSENV